jgi:hypothetical protein
VAKRPAGRTRRGANTHGRRLRERALRALGPRWLQTSLALAVALTGLARLDRVTWPSALLRELDLQLCLLALLLAAAALAQRAWLALALTLAVAGAWALPIAALARATRPTPTAGPHLRLLGAHLTEPSLSSAALLTELIAHKVDAALLTAEDPAALRLADAGGAAREAAPELRGYRRFRHATDAGAWLLYVRQELTPRGLGSVAQPAVLLHVGRCSLGLQPLVLPALTAHGARDIRARALTELARAPKLPRSVWFGQLGSQPGAPDVSPLLRAQELRDGRAGYGRLASWPAALGPLGLAREQLLLRGWLRVAALQADEPLARGAQRTWRATLELTDSRCQPSPGT